MVDVAMSFCRPFGASELCRGSIGRKKGDRRGVQGEWLISAAKSIRWRQALVTKAVCGVAHFAAYKVGYRSGASWSDPKAVLGSARNFP